ncbi:MAG: hypothetical protein ACJ72D_10895 [Marmoricola sp.]
MTSTPTHRSVLARRIAAVCGTGVLLVAAAACGSSNQEKDAASQNGYGGPSTVQNGGGQQGQRPGADGKVAAVSGSTAQVQSAQAGQVAVTWTGTTTFTQQVTARLSDVRTGDCVAVTSASTGTGSTAPTTAPTRVTAETVRITPATNGACTAGPGGQTRGSGQGPQLQGGGPAAGGPEGGGQPPAGAPDGGSRQLRGFGGAFGTVTSVSGTGFVVSSTRPAASSGTTTTTKITVTVTAATTYTTTAKASASDVRVGVCVRAEGAADSTGAVTATRIAVSPAVNGECAAGFVRGGDRPGTNAGAGAGSGSTTQDS